MENVKMPQFVTLTVPQATQLARLLDAKTVQQLAQARDKLRRLFNAPPFELKD